MKQLKKWVSYNFDLIRSVLYRLVRGAVATALAQTLALQVDWAKPEVAIKALAVSFVTGFLLALGKTIREIYGADNKDGKVDRMLPI